MGLPLWREPEADSSANLARQSPSDPIHDRSRIRRPRRPRGSRGSSAVHRLRETREQRLRMLGALHNGDDQALLTSGSPNAPPNPEISERLDVLERLHRRGARNATVEDEDPAIDPDIAALIAHPPRASLGELAHSDDPAEDITARIRQYMNSTRGLQSHRPIGPISARREDAIGPISARREDAIGILEDFDGFWPITRDRDAAYFTAGFEDLDTYRSRSRRLPSIPRARFWPNRDEDEASFQLSREERLPHELDDAYSGHRRIGRQSIDLDIPPSSTRRAHRVRYADGLGDRDRSLSPEGDGVWDTLQSTLTPDPQPPSVGSSFVSTVASQNPAIPSSRTSITTPGDDVEPPCDPVNEADDAIEDGRGAEIERLDRPRRPTPHGRRSYAEVAADDQEWLAGMHRIVHGLAAREDIPDEWWAEAGLTRSASWDG